MAKPTGFWKSFDNWWNEFKPYLDKFMKEKGRPPSWRELFKLNRADITNAAWRHHGGYHNLLVKLGFYTKLRQKPGTWNDIQKIKEILWSDPKIRLNLLRGELPSTKEWSKLGLRHLQLKLSLKKKSVKEFAKQLGLQSYEEAIFNRRTRELLTFFLTFVRNNDRVPRGKEIPNIVWQRIRRRGGIQSIYSQLEQMPSYWQAFASYWMKQIGQARRNNDAVAEKKAIKEHNKAILARNALLEETDIAET